MKLNPIVALSEQLQKLINEHGSASILRDHLALFKDQLIIRDKEFAVLTSQNHELKLNIEKLKSQLDNCTKEIERLNEIITPIQSPQGPKEYDPITNKIIKLFFDAGDDLSIDDIVRAFSMDSSTVRYHLDLLLDNGFIEETTNVFADTPETFLITKAGRKHIIET